ncbi:MAG: TIGR04086 family membrane protein [Lachnospiraceae bacterium]|nr:TIGR04086 family membrane protein [Lachnospiraceae bacterium]
MSKSMKVLEVIRSLVAAYIFTGVALAALAFVIYKWDLNETIVNIVIMAVYVIASFIGGFITGKRVKERKFFWGLLMGGLYILIIYGVSMIMSVSLDMISTANVAACLLCLGGGMLGGMVS